jgi:hypothetical protein
MSESMASNTVLLAVMGRMDFLNRSKRPDTARLQADNTMATSDMNAG